MNMDDPPVNPPGRETKAWENADGEASLGDKVGDAGDEVRTDLGNAGDDLRDAMDDATEDAKDEYRESEADSEAARRQAEVDQSLADKLGNAGDEVQDVLLVDLDADGDPDLLVVVDLPEPPYNPPDNSRKVGPESPEHPEEDPGEGTHQPG
jgi:hypothetical protein